MQEKEFLDDVEKAIALYEVANGYVASRTRQMIADHGTIKALSLLMVSPDLQQGFKVLRDSKQLDRTFESIVVKFRCLFESDVVEAAQWRLAHPYDLLRDH
jgi:hypothetical protein